MQSLRKITDIRYMQSRQQRVCLHRIYYQFGKYQYLLPLKSIFQLYHIPSLFKIPATNIHNENGKFKQKSKIVHIKYKTFYFSVC